MFYAIIPTVYAPFGALPVIAVTQEIAEQRIILDTLPLL